MTTPPTIVSAARALMPYFDAQRCRDAARDNPKGCASCAWGGVIHYQSVADLADALDALPPDAVVCSRELLESAMYELAELNTLTGRGSEYTNGLLNELRQAAGPEKTT